MTTSGTMNDNESQRMTSNGSKWSFRLSFLRIIWYWYGYRRNEKQVL